MRSKSFVSVQHPGIADVLPGAGLHVLSSRTGVLLVYGGFAFMTASQIPEEAYNV